MSLRIDVGKNSPVDIKDVPEEKCELSHKTQEVARAALGARIRGLSINTEEANVESFSQEDVRRELFNLQMKEIQGFIQRFDYDYPKSSIEEVLEEIHPNEEVKSQSIQEGVTVRCRQKVGHENKGYKLKSTANFFS